MEFLKKNAVGIVGLFVSVLFYILTYGKSDSDGLNFFFAGLFFGILALLILSYFSNDNINS